MSTPCQVVRLRGLARRRPGTRGVDRGGGVLAGAEEASWTPEHLAPRRVGPLHADEPPLPLRPGRGHAHLEQHGARDGHAARVGRPLRVRRDRVRRRRLVRPEARRRDDRDLLAKAERDCFVGASLDRDAVVRLERGVSATLLDVAAASGALHRAPPATRLLRRPRRDAVPRRGDRRDRAVPPPDNANVGAPYETSRRTDALVALAHERAGAFLGCDPGEVAFGQSMTSLNFLLTRALARELEAGDEIARDAARPRRQRRAVARARGRHRHRRPRSSTSTTTSRSTSTTSQRSCSDRTRVVAFPAAANSVGTAPDIRRVVELAHEVGALAWVDAVHYGPHGPIDVAAWGCDVLICSPYKFFGPHMGLAFGREELLRQLAAVQGAPGSG